MRNLKGKVSIIMPAYNEGAIIAKNLLETIRIFHDFGCVYEVVVIDDGSTDDTLAQALDVARRHPVVKVKRNMENYGKGRALKKAVRYIEGDYVVFLDADLDLHPGQAQALFDILRLDDADIVIGSKLHPNSVVQYPLSRRIISLVYYFLIKSMFGLPVHDTQTGLKVFKTEVVKKVFPKILVRQFAFDLEVLAYAHHLGFRIVEAPIVLRSQRPYGRIGLKAMWQTGWDTLAIFYRMYFLRGHKKPKDNKDEI